MEIDLLLEVAAKRGAYRLAYNGEHRLMIAEVLIHHLDTARYLCGPLRVVSARTRNSLAEAKGETIAAIFLETETGCPVSHSSILLRLMEHGLPQFEKDLQNLRVKANADKKRFPRLQLIYTQHRPL